MISSVVNRTRWQRNDFCLLWTVVVESSTGSVHHVQKNLWTCLILVPKATISCFKKDFCIRNFNCYTIDGFIWFHPSWTKVVDNVKTSVCCEQLSLKTQPVLSIMNTNLWTCLIIVQKATICCFWIDLCIRNFNCYKIDLLMLFYLSWTEVVDNVTTSVCCEQLSLKTQPVLSIMYTNLWTCLILVQKATIRCFRIDLCIRNFNWY